MKVQKIVTTFLAGLMLFSLAGCKNTETGTTTTPVQPTADRDVHFVENTLHKVKVTPSNTIFTANKKTEYTIVLGNAAMHTAAGEFIFTHVREATGASLPIREGGTWAQDAKYIVLGDEEMFAQAGLTMPTDDIGLVGYYVKTVGNSVFIMSKSQEGYQLGSIAFLREVVGYDMLAADCVIYEKDGKTLPQMDIVERPDYDVRVISNIMTKAGKYGMGYTDGGGIVSIDGYWVHNSFKYLPPETYNKKYLNSEDELLDVQNPDYHPDWYTDVLLVANGKEYRQICYTAHGNQDEYDLMQDEIVGRMLKYIAEQPQYSIITFTQEDVPYHCQCETCLKVVEKYGSYSAAILMFTNDLADKLDAKLQEIADAENTEKREMTVAFFAYHVSEAPPAKKDENGNWKAIDGIKTNDNVSVFIAPIYAKYNRSLYDDINRIYADNIAGWTAVSDKIMMWLYQTNYAQYLYPFNTWDSQVENYRLCKEAGAMYMFNEGQYEQAVVTHFTRLKEYIDSKALFDVNIDQNAVVDKFFKYYFREAEKPMRQFFDELQAHMSWLETEYESSLTGHIRDQIAQSMYWPQRKIEGWLELIDQAYAAVEKYKETDSATYNMLTTHIRIESLFPRYVMCSLHWASFSANKLQQMRQEFYNDCSTFNITKIYEHTSISGLFESWGVA